MNQPTADRTTAPGSLRPPSLGSSQASLRLPGRFCLSVSFLQEGTSGSEVPSGGESSAQSRVVTSGRALGSTGQGNFPWGHTPLDGGCGGARGCGSERSEEAAAVGR